jgi:tRNA nucleotidyltransferase (CCA-adding enzyme)
MWEHFHHEADVGVRGLGDSTEQAFAEAAVALTAVITDPETVHCRDTVTLACSAYEMATRHMLFRDFRVALDGTQLRASACGEAIDVARHQPATEIKGATYTQLAVREDRPGEWRAQCVVDV